MAYPDDIFDPRVIENMPNVVYDPDKKTVFFAEDHDDITGEIIDVEETLGTNPEGIFDTVRERLENVDTKIAPWWRCIKNLTPAIPGFFPNTVIIPFVPPGEAISVTPLIFISGGYFTTRLGAISKDYQILGSGWVNAVGSLFVSLKYIDVQLDTILPNINVLPGTIIGGNPRISVLMYFDLSEI